MWAVGAQQVAQSQQVWAEVRSAHEEPPGHEVRAADVVRSEHVSRAGVRPADAQQVAHEQQVRIEVRSAREERPGHEVRAADAVRSEHVSRAGVRAADAQQLAHERIEVHSPRESQTAVPSGDETWGRNALHSADALHFSY
jgi:hypothetical protein